MDYSIVPAEAGATRSARIAKPRAPERESAAWEVARRCAEVLRRRGAARVVLFGSLAVDNFGPDSDVDIMVYGFTSAQLCEAMDVSDVGDEAGIKVDIVGFERASPRLLKWVARDGIDL